MVGIFHTFAHAYECQVLFSPRNIVGIGLTDGEGCERIWSLARHIIASLRGSTSYRRLQLLTNLMLDIGERKHFGLALSFVAFFHATLKKIRECKQQLKAYQMETGVNMKELQRQAKLMHEYFENREEQTSDINDDICETIMAMQAMKEFDVAYHGLSDSARTSIAYLNLQMHFNWRTGGRIDSGLDVTQNQLSTRLTQLLHKAKQHESLWLNDDGSTTDHYRNVLRSLPFAELRRLRHEIWIVLVCRKQEYHEVKASSLMGNPISALLLIVRDEGSRSYLFYNHQTN
jgi:Kyakuja-Dileera-Zisupton transposase